MPFSLVYDTEAVIPVQIVLEMAQVEAYGDDNVERRSLDLDLIDERRDAIFIRLLAYENKIYRAYNLQKMGPTSVISDLGLGGRGGKEARLLVGEHVSSCSLA